MPFRSRNDPRNDIKGDQTLLRLGLAVDVEGDPGETEQILCLALLGTQPSGILVIQPCIKPFIGLAQAVLRSPHFVKALGVIHLDCPVHAPQSSEKHESAHCAILCLSQRSPRHEALFPVDLVPRCLLCELSLTSVLKNSAYQSAIQSSFWNRNAQHSLDRLKNCNGGCADMSDKNNSQYEMKDQQSSGMGYGRFAAMITTSTIVMFGLMYLNTFLITHVFWSETRVYMAILMGA